MNPHDDRGASAPGRAAACPVTSHNEKAPGPGATGAKGTHGKTNMKTVPHADPDDKMLGQLRARAARSGATLHALAGGGFLIGRWGWARELPDLRAVSTVLDKITGAR